MRYCGRIFSADEINFIQNLIAAEPGISRYRLSTKVCEGLNWRRPDGKLKDMSCRVAMLRMDSDEVIKLPPPKRNKPPIYGVHPEIERAVMPPDDIAEVDLRQLVVEIVEKKSDSLLWNTFVQRHHYLGHQPMPGAQLRYFIRSKNTVVALLSFGASAWKTKPRNDFIGWTDKQRQQNLHLVVNNARFLILPWITCKNLASRILGMVSRRLADDWEARYSYRPVLLETFVDDSRYRGTCYRAANWHALGKTQGRGKIDRLHKYEEPIKTIWVYPLIADFRNRLRK